MHLANVTRHRLVGPIEITVTCVIIARGHRQHPHDSVHATVSKYQRVPITHAMCAETVLGLFLIITTKITQPNSQSMRHVRAAHLRATTQCEHSTGGDVREPGGCTQHLCTQWLLAHIHAQHVPNILNGHRCIQYGTPMMLSTPTVVPPTRSAPISITAMSASSR